MSIEDASNPAAHGVRDGQSRLSPAARRRWSAVSGAILVHLGVALMCLGGLSGGKLSQLDLAGEDDNAIEVTLAGIDGAPRAASPPQDSPQLAALMQRVAQSQPAELTASNKIAPSSPSPAANLDALMQAVDPAASSGKSGTNGKSDSGTGRGAGSVDTQSARDDKAKAGKPGQVGAANAGDGDLWAQIEPCWRKMPGSAKVSVTLEVALKNGRVSSPPKILRPNGQSADEARLAAEAKALLALSRCGPYVGQFKASNRVEFPLF